MTLNKWNWQTREYEETQVPDLCYSIFEDKMDTVVNCPHCFRAMLFGDSYCSTEFHSRQGSGYAVCESCYRKELQRRFDAEGRPHAKTHVLTVDEIPYHSQTCQTED